MSEKTPQNYAAYNRYMERSDSPSSQVENEESNSVVNDTDRLSSEITLVQNNLLSLFPNLSLISSTIEDTIIVVDDDGNETEDSLKRRTEVLKKLKEAYEKDKALKEKVQKVLPSFCDDLNEVLGDKYYSIYDTARSTLIKICNYVSLTPTYDYDDDFDEEYADDEYEDDTYVEEEETSDSQEKSEFPDKSPFDLYMKISDDLDTSEFQKACILAKTYLKYQMELYQRRIGRETVLESDLLKFRTRNNDSLDEICKYTAYLNMPKTFEPKNPVLTEKDDNDNKDSDEYTL